MSQNQRVSSEQWRMILMGEHPDLVRQRRILRHLPWSPAAWAPKQGPGELLMSVATATAADVPTGGLEPRHLDIVGRSEPLDVLAERVPDAVASAS